MLIKLDKQYWIDNYPEYRNELESLSDAEIQDRFYRNLEFGTGGMRGIIGAGENRMNSVIVRRVTRALASVLPNDASVVIGYDSRNYSQEFAQEAVNTLSSYGIKIYLFDSLRPVPMLSFAVRYLHADAGVEITASHNPPQYNGYKIYWNDGSQIPPLIAEQIAGQIKDDPSPLCIKPEFIHSVQSEVDDAYVTDIKSLAINPDMLREHGHELSVVYSPLHGSGNTWVRRVLTESGIMNLHIVKEQEEPTGDFPTVSVPNPEEKDTMTLAIQLANEVGADVALATDPDCDRLGVAVRDRDGSYMLLTGNQIGCLLLHYILSHKVPNNGVVITTIVTTSMIKAITESFGIETRECLTGFKFIAEMMQQLLNEGKEFLFGCEESYGYLSNTNVRDKDAVNASLLVAELALWLKLRGMTMVEYLDELYKKYGYYVDSSKSITLNGSNGLAKINGIMTILRNEPPRSIGGNNVIAIHDYQSGLKYEGDSVTRLHLPISNVLYYELEGGNWLCIRPSGTELKIKLYSCAKSSLYYEAWYRSKSYISELNSIIRNI